ncbi:uncharacterized protein METZ01_LOCUS367735 [marine metagenome]|uniref:Uncharacterized protein n=1 Tax=marine metagenome TaxID=408172 RepID=A0A382T0W8_9ZZZZ
MPRIRLLWANEKQTIQYIEDSSVDWLPIERDQTLHTFRATDKLDAENLPVYRETLPTDEYEPSTPTRR